LAVPSPHSEAAPSGPGDPGGHDDADDQPNTINNDG
jgi:hypothetical protein